MTNKVFVCGFAVDDIEFPFSENQIKQKIKIVYTHIVQH